MDCIAIAARTRHCGKVRYDMCFCGRNGKVELDMCFIARTSLSGAAKRGTSVIFINIFIGKSRIRIRYRLHTNLHIELDLTVKHVLYRSKCASGLRGDHKKYTWSTKLHIELRGPFRTVIYISNSTRHFDCENTYPSLLRRSFSALGG